MFYNILIIDKFIVLLYIFAALTISLTKNYY